MSFNTGRCGSFRNFRLHIVPLTETRMSLDMFSHIHVHRKLFLQVPSFDNCTTDNGKIPVYLINISKLRRSTLFSVDYTIEIRKLACIWPQCDFFKSGEKSGI